MYKILAIALILVSPIALAAPILDEVLSLEAGKEKLLTIKTEVPVSVNVELITENLAKAIQCKSCLHLSHKLLDGHILQKNSSSLGVGFIRVIPEEGAVQLIVSHDHPSTQNIRITVNSVK